MDEISSRTQKEGKKKKPTPSLASSEPNSIKATSDKDIAADDIEDNQTGGSIPVTQPKGRKSAKKQNFNDVEVRKGQRELIKISRDKMLAMQMVAEEAIMSKDTSSMDDISKKFYEIKKKRDCYSHGPVVIRCPARQYGCACCDSSSCLEVEIFLFSHSQLFFYLFLPLLFD